MKRILLTLVLLLSFCFLVKALSNDVCAESNFSEPILMASNEESITLAKTSTSCRDACEAERTGCKNACADDNITCQRACEHSEECIYSCGKTYTKCVDSCNTPYYTCITKCPRYNDGW
jgi:hypothetical protein